MTKVIVLDKFHVDEDGDTGATVNGEWFGEITEALFKAVPDEYSNAYGTLLIVYDKTAQEQTDEEERQWELEHPVSDKETK